MPSASLADALRREGLTLAWGHSGVAEHGAVVLLLLQLLEQGEPGRMRPHDNRFGSQSGVPGDPFACPLLGSSSVAIGVVPALPGELVDELERDARDRLHAALERTGMNRECLVTRGTAAASIVNAATEVATELVVIGMRGRSNLSRLLLGSVAESVLPTAPCSVMVVHLAR